MEQQMTIRDKENLAARARDVIDAFLAMTPTPTTEQWKQLIQEHKEFAGEIADAAIFSAGATHLTEFDEEAPLNVEAYNATVSDAINLVHKTPSPTEAHIERQVEEVRGRAIRSLAADCGLAAAPALLSSVLAGSVVAPRQLVRFLSQRFGASGPAILGYLQSSFFRQCVPSYKAENGKPEVAIHQMPWADAVRASQLSAEETQKLLDLDA
jgi:hypothetical protein